MNAFKVTPFTAKCLKNAGEDIVKTYNDHHEQFLRYFSRTDMGAIILI